MSNELKTDSGNVGAPVVPLPETAVSKKSAWWKIALAVLLLALVGGFLARNRIAVSVVESVGSKVAGVPVTVGALDVSVFGSGEAGEFSVANPAGFSAPAALSVKKAFAAVKIFSLLGDTIRVNKIEIDGVEVNCETAGTKNNLAMILASALSYSSGTGSAQGGVVLSEGEIKNIKINMAFPGDASDAFVISIDSVSLSTEKGFASLKGLRVGNPSGFSDAAAVEIAFVDIKFSFPALLIPDVIIDEIVVDGVAVNLEPGAPDSNLGRHEKLLRQLDEIMGGGGGSVTVRRFFLKTATGQAGPFSVTLADIEVKDVSSRSLAGSVVNIALALTPQMGKFLGDVASGLKTGVLTAPKNLGTGLKAIGKGFGGLFNKGDETKK
jgi:hypothetical protein